MLAQSQGRNEQVVNSYNLFIDSAKDVGGAAGKGDSFSLQLGADSIQAQDGQFLRLTLQEFSMYTNFYMVNINNCRFRLTDDAAATELLLTQQNYKNVADVAANFATALAAAKHRRRSDVHASRHHTCLWDRPQRHEQSYHLV